MVRSDVGSFVAEAYLGSSVWDLFADWYNPATARWAVVSGSVRDRPRALIGKPVLTVTSHPEAPERTVDFSGCGSGIGGEITDLDDEDNTIRYRPDLGGVYMGCSEAEGEQAGWITEVLADRPTVDVVGGRARISSDAGTLLLVRLD